jgi:hypothetical protein
MRRLGTLFAEVVEEEGVMLGRAVKLVRGQTEVVRFV